MLVSNAERMLQSRRRVLTNQLIIVKQLRTEIRHKNIEFTQLISLSLTKRFFLRDSAQLGANPEKNGQEIKTWMWVWAKLQKSVITEAHRWYHHHHHRRGVAGEGRRVIASPCPRSTARPQSSPVRWMESFHSWSSHLFHGRPGGRRHVRSGGRLSDTLMWSWRAMFAGVSLSSRATCPNMEMCRRDRRCDSKVRPVIWLTISVL